VTLLGDGGDVVVIRILQRSFRGAGDLSTGEVTLSKSSKIDTKIDARGFKTGGRVAAADRLPGHGWGVPNLLGTGGCRPPFLMEVFLRFKPFCKPLY
jgi:hypothetical protein